MSKKPRQSDQKQISMLLPIEGTPASKPPTSSSVEYRSKEFYEIRNKMIQTLPQTKIG